MVRVELDLPPGLTHAIHRLAAERSRPVQALLVDLLHVGVRSLLDPSRENGAVTPPVDGPFVQLSDRDAICRVLVERHERDPDGAPDPPSSCPPLEGR